MTRKEMLKILGKLEFALIDPGPWKDVGFTEREIWVNSKGYGYLSCDEPIACWDGEGVSEDKWKEIKSLLEADMLTYEDIKGTSLEELIEDLFYGNYDYDDQDLNYTLRGLLDLENGATGHLYAMDTIEGPEYFDNEKDFKAAYERDWADCCWEEMDDELLAVWIARLRNEKHLI